MSVPDPPEPLDSPPEPKKRHLVRWIVVGVVIVLVGGTFLLWRSRQVHVSLPASVSGQTQIQGPAYEAARAQADSSMGQNANEHVLGWYGNNARGAPGFAVFAEVVRYPNEDPFLSAPGGAPTAGMAIDVSKETNWSVGDVRYQCAPFSGSSQVVAGGTICFWSDNVTVGYVVIFDPSLDSRSMIAAAHDAVVS